MCRYAYSPLVLSFVTLPSPSFGGCKDTSPSPQLLKTNSLLTKFLFWKIRFCFVFFTKDAYLC